MSRAIQTTSLTYLIINHSEENKIFHQKVARITFSSNGWYLECDKDLEYATDHILLDKMYKGKRVDNGDGYLDIIMNLCANITFLNHLSQVRTLFMR